MNVVLYQLKLQNKVPLFIATLFTIILPMMIGLENLNMSEMVYRSELFFLIIGMVIVPAIMISDDNENILSQTLLMPYSYPILYGIRIIITIVILLLLNGCLLLYSLINHCNFNFLYLLPISVLNGLYMGSIILVLYLLTKQVSLGYLATFSYYYFEYATKGQFTKDFYLFGLLNNNNQSKLYLLLITCVLLFSLLVYTQIKQPSSS